MNLPNCYTVADIDDLLLILQNDMLVIKNYRQGFQAERRVLMVFGDWIYFSTLITLTGEAENWRVRFCLRSTANARPPDLTAS